jgi:hypothetical protein
MWSIPPEDTRLHCRGFLPFPDVYRMRTFVSPFERIASFLDRIESIRSSFPTIPIRHRFITGYI